MKLSEHPDFEQAILQAADQFRDRGLRPALIEVSRSMNRRRALTLPPRPSAGRVCPTHLE